MGGKRMVALAMKMLNYKVIAFGDSYNDIEMIKEADVGFLFRPNEKIRREFPEIPVAENFEEARAILEKYIG
jgi:phosphoserine/homoserine phosphotransferase